MEQAERERERKKTSCFFFFVGYKNEEVTKYVEKKL